MSLLLAIIRHRLRKTKKTKNIIIIAIFKNILYYIYERSPQQWGERRAEEVNQEQRDNLAKLETIRDNLRAYLDRANLCGYQPSQEERDTFAEILRLARWGNEWL